MYPNTPNPFSRDSEVAYRLTSDAQSASIGIYDLNGRLLKQYPLNTYSTTGKVQVMASDFERGMYIYALVIDGNIIDSKRMLVGY